MIVRKLVFLNLFLFIFLTSVIHIVSAQAQQYNFTYDANGNLVQGYDKYFNYDDFNRLSSVRNTNSSGSLVAQYFYDANGDRIKKVEVTSLGNKTTYYISKNFVQVVNEDGSISNETYYYDESDLIASKKDSVTSFYHPDNLGSTTLVTDQSGNSIEENSYAPYGDPIEEGSSRYLYTGEEKDDENGLYYYGARYYSTDLRKFTQPDSVLPNVYDPQQLNRYSYAINNPYKYTDPTGNYVEFVTRGLNNPYPYDGNNLIKQGLSAIAASVARHFTHSYFDVTPDNPKDFEGDTNFQLGAYPSSGNIFKEGTLTYEKNGEGGKNVEYSRVLLNTPEGKTDTEFINDLIAGGNRLNSADVPYSINPLAGGKGANSNTFARTAIDNAESSLSSGTYEGLAPGPVFITSPGLNKEYNFDTQKIENANKNSPYQRFKNFFSTSRNSRNRK